MAQAPPPEAVSEAEQTRDTAEQLALALLAGSAAGGQAPDEDEESLLLKAFVAHIIAGLWRSLFGSKRPTFDEPIPTVDEMAEAVYDDAEPVLRPFIKRLRESIDTPAELKTAAATLATAAYNAIAEMFAKDHLPIPAGLDRESIRKTWVTRADRRVRPLHRKLHGKTKPLNADFWRWPATGQQLGFPGDLRAPLDATIGCRCLLLISWGTEGMIAPMLPPMPSVEEAQL